MSRSYRLAVILGPLFQKGHSRVLMGNKVPAGVSTGVCASNFASGVLKDGEDPNKLTSKDWKDRLSPEQYHVARQKGTEVPWSGRLLANRDKGTYYCICCGSPLFHSKEKFDSGSGWPSFYDVHKSEDGQNNVKEDQDESLGMVRVEVMCKQCDGHLGHVFNDGPKPTGLRYCINSASLGFEKDE